MASAYQDLYQNLFNASGNRRLKAFSLGCLYEAGTIPEFHNLQQQFTNFADDLEPVVNWLVDYLLRSGQLKAPPDNMRTFAIAEATTVLIAYPGIGIKA